LMASVTPSSASQLTYSAATCSLWAANSRISSTVRAEDAKVSAAVMHSVLEDIPGEIVGANVDASHQIDRTTDAPFTLHSLIILRTPFTPQTPLVSQRRLPWRP
jgi:hypothetical protein